MIQVLLKNTQDQRVWGSYGLVLMGGGVSHPLGSMIIVLGTEACCLDLLQRPSSIPGVVVRSVITRQALKRLALRAAVFPRGVGIVHVLPHYH